MGRWLACVFVCLTLAESNVLAGIQYDEIGNALWSEDPDAQDKSLPQTIVGSQTTPLISIAGELDGLADVDAFRFRIDGGGATQARYVFGPIGIVCLTLYLDDGLTISKQDGDSSAGDSVSYHLADGLYVLEIERGEDVVDEQLSYALSLQKDDPEGLGGEGQIYAAEPESAVPEPATLAIWGIGVFGLAMMRRRRAS